MFRNFYCSCVQLIGFITEATGLRYYNARYYDPELGMFISPDTIVADPTNVLDYNRYLYARGNPISYNDPSGHIPEREACSYLGACSESEFTDMYGQELTTLLWGTDVTWGDKLEWSGGNVAMLLLLDPGTGHHSGVLWGIEGDTVGNSISLERLYQSGATGFDITSKAPSVNSVHDLPMARELRYNGWYRTKYVDISEAYVATAAVGTSGVIGNTALKWALGFLTGSTTLGTVLDDFQVPPEIANMPSIGPAAEGFQY